MQVENGYTTQSVTIANGQSLSGAFSTQGRRLLAIEMPTSWTAAGLYIQGAFRESGPYFPISDQGGTEIAITAAASKILVLSTTASLVRLPWLRIGSGTSAAPVNQGAARTLTALLSSLGT